MGRDQITQCGEKQNKKSISFLGIEIDDKLKWDQHINKIINKLRTIIYSLNQTKNLLPLKIKLLLYKGLFMPHIEYCIQIWGHCSKRDKIQKLMKWGLRCVYNKKGIAIQTISL